MKVNNPFNGFTVKRSVQPAAHNVFTFPKKVEEKPGTPVAETNHNEETTVTSVVAHVEIQNNNKTVQTQESVVAETETVADTVVENTMEEEQTAEQTADKPKRKRRTKAEMAAARAAEAALAGEQSEPPVTEPADAEDQSTGSHVEEAVEITPIKYNAGSVTLQDIADKFVTIAEDPAWEEFETDMRNRLNQIKITRDINFGSARILLEQITDLFIILNDKKAEINAMDATFNDKVTGLISRAKAVNGSGKNTDERAKNANAALEAFPFGRQKVNICDFALALNTRKEIIYALLADVDQKQKALFSYLAIMKLETKVEN